MTPRTYSQMLQMPAHTLFWASYAGDEPTLWAKEDSPADRLVARPAIVSPELYGPTVWFGSMEDEVADYWVVDRETMDRLLRATAWAAGCMADIERALA